MSAIQSSELATAVQEVKREIRKGRWFKNTLYILAISYLILLILVSAGVVDQIDPAKRIASIKLQGEISSETINSAALLAPAIRKAAEDERVQHIVLQLNSPGGTPSQAERLWQVIRTVREENPEKKIYVTIDELCTSACYYIATAADEIHATRVSLIGSIGVRMGGFGFVGAMEKHGVEQRELTAGEHKALLDPFSPRDEESEAFLREHVLATTHQIFIERVKEGRGEVLSSSEELFTGLVWVGKEAREIGLIDGHRSTHEIAEALGIDKVVDYTPKVDLFEQYASQFATSLASALRGSTHSRLEM